MSLPTLTAEQRAAALDKARDSRRYRAAVLDELAAGQTSLAELLITADHDAVIAKTRVSQTLRRVRGLGPTKITRLMQQIGIPDGRRLGGLGQRQRDALLAAVER
jgi:antitoxin component HigA of HigAB toxin-antitoxin module